MLATNGETKTPTGGADLPSTLRMESYKLSISEKMYSNKGAHLSEQNTSSGGSVETKSSVVAYVGTKGGGNVLEARTIGLHSFLKHLPNAKPHSHPLSRLILIERH